MPLTFSVQPCFYLLSNLLCCHPGVRWHRIMFNFSSSSWFWSMNIYCDTSTIYYLLFFGLYQTQSLKIVSLIPNISVIIVLAILAIQCLCDIWNVASPPVRLWLWCLLCFWHLSMSESVPSHIAPYFFRRPTKREFLVSKKSENQCWIWLTARMNGWQPENDSVVFGEWINIWHWSHES